MNAGNHAVLAHHQAAATMWGRGGKHYDDVSFAVSDALAHAAQRLNAHAGERILDVATGTGWSARNVARTGATVIGVDISQELLAAACELSQHVRPAIEFRTGDVECLPFADGAFVSARTTAHFRRINAPSARPRGSGDPAFQTTTKSLWFPACARMSGLRPEAAPI
jgi:ubiquinone/menaquinone biosynthesis C-methylase UbiE